MINKLNILLVEDSNLVRYKIKKAFEQFAIELFELDNAEDIFRFAGRYQKMDLIILDISLPDMDGITALERMHMNEAWKSTPVIMLTAKADRQTVEKAFKTGAINYVRKPFTDEDLLERIEQTLGQLPLSLENSEVCSEEELHKQINNEIERAKLGNYEFSLLEIDMKGNTQNLDNLEDLIKLRDEIRFQLKDIDNIFITIDYNLILLLPFVDEKEAITVSDKLFIWLNEKYKEKYKTYKVTFPQNGEDSKKLLYSIKTMKTNGEI